jgi:hypothetical protein
VDCNSNQTRDECDIAEGTSQDCNVNMLPDECEPGSPFPAELISCGPMFGQSLWRTQNNVVRLTFACDITAPDSGDVVVQELLSAGAFGSDLSGDFTFTVEDTASGKPRILKINAEPDATLSHQIWYGVRNTGDWGAAAPFEVHYVNLIGDATNDNLVQYSDLSLINSEVPCFSSCDERKDINGDSYVLSSDVLTANEYVGTGAPAKPGGHASCTVCCP